MSLVAIQLNKEKISILFSLHVITEQYPSFYIPFLFAATAAHHHHHHCHHPILGDSPKVTFFQNKNQKNKIKAGNAEKADQERLQK